VYKTAKQIDPDLNVIVITGYPDSEMLDRILQISPVTVLKKPLKIEQLNQTVKILGHSTASPSFSTRGVGDPGSRSRWTPWSKGLYHRSDVFSPDSGAFRES